MKYICFYIKKVIKSSLFCHILYHWNICENVLNGNVVISSTNDTVCISNWSTNNYVHCNFHQRSNLSINDLILKILSKFSNWMKNYLYSHYHKSKTVLNIFFQIWKVTFWQTLHFWEKKFNGALAGLVITFTPFFSTSLVKIIYLFFYFCIV